MFELYMFVMLATMAVVSGYIVSSPKIEKLLKL